MVALPRLHPFLMHIPLKTNTENTSGNVTLTFLDLYELYRAKKLGKFLKFESNLHLVKSQVRHDKEKPKTCENGPNGYPSEQQLFPFCTYLLAKVEKLTSFMTIS